MTTKQKLFSFTLLAGCVGTGVYEANRAAHLGTETQALALLRDSLTQQNQQLQQERDQAVNKLEAARQGVTRSREDLSELLRLRAEVAKLRSDSRELTQLKAARGSNDNDPAEVEMKSWLSRVGKLKEKVLQRPDQRIPELQLLTEKDWIDAVRNVNGLETEADLAQALSGLRSSAKGEFASILQNALRNYAQAGNGQPPTDLAQLKPYLPTEVDDAVLQRYEIARPGTVAEKRTPLGDQDDKYYQISMNVIGTGSAAENLLEGAVAAFSAANNGQEPTDPLQLQPYAKTAAEQAALQTLMQKAAAK